MIISLSKEHPIFKALFLAFSVFFATFFALQTTNAESHELVTSDHVAPAITDAEINEFLFHINEKVQGQVKMLSGEIIEHLPIPILFEVSVGDFTDNFGEARSGGRVHEGIDIIAPVGTLIVSPTDSVVTKIGYDNKGGNFVVTANPGGEQLYFAHLDRVAENLYVGDALKPGDLIGYVGSTGNARGKSSHLHLGIYHQKVALNPFPRLMREFSAEEKTAALEKILTDSKVVLGASSGGVRFLQRFLINKNIGSYANTLAKTGATGYFGSLTKNALAEYQRAVGINPASGYFGPVTKTNILTALNSNIVITKQTTEAFVEKAPEAETPYYSVKQVKGDLEIGSSGKEVVWLQDFLINADSGPRARSLAIAGVTGYFGTLTKNALIEYQLMVGINPASGYFGSITRSSIKILAEINSLTRGQD
jgi:peptidoglycan LD-endopeptidase LytH